ncbi:MAG: hypothetical protein WCT14_03375 [Treponemataceae bacterium]
MDALLSRIRCFARVLIFIVLPLAAYATPVSPIPFPGGESRSEAPSTLLSVDIEKGEAELFIGGSWKGEIVAASGIALTGLGASLSQTDSPFLFTQTIDLTVSATILKHWFVEATFLDDYALNTYRAGYLGAEGDAIRYVGIGNVGLDFPAFPYADISGGTPSSFGAYAAFGAGPLTLHALVRYDAATREEKTYVGSSERTISDISPAKRLRGRAFALPDRNLDAVPVVYLEDTEGTISGSDGRKYRSATATEAAGSAMLGLVELASTPTGRVVVAYAKSGSTTPWNSSLGSYGVISTRSGFLGDTQTAFDTSGASIALSAYPQCGGGNGEPAEITLGGTNPALVIYESGAFSPFEFANRYAPTSSAASDASARLVYASSGSSVKGFELEESSSSSFTINTNADGETVVSTSGRFFILSSAVSTDTRSIESRFPLVSIDPEVYLPGAKGRATDIVVRYTSYGASGAYNIGTDVVAGSVIVTRGGIRDPLATYNAESGTVALNSPAGTGELIRISYLKTSQDRRFGSLAAGLGAVYTPDPSFSARAALSLRWNVSGNAFTADDESSPGNIALSGSAKWKKEELKAEIAGALTYEAPDTTGLYRAVSMEGTEFSLGMSVSASSAAYPPLTPTTPDSALTGLFAGFLSYVDIPSADNAGKLVYRDYSSNDVLGNKTLKTISWTGASIDTSKTGPYPVSVSELDDKTAYVAEYALGEGKAINGGFALWSGFQMELADEAETLAEARTIIIPYRYFDLDGDDPVRTYLQIGALANEDGEAESKELVWSRPLGATVSDSVSETAWAYASYDLSDLDRARLASARALRLVVRLDKPATTPASTVAASGRVLVLPPVVQGAVFRPVLVSGGSVTTASDKVSAAEKIDATLAATFSSEISRLHPDGEAQRVLTSAWSSLTANEAAGIDGYPSPFPLWSYRSITFFMRGPVADVSSDATALKTSTVRLIIGANSEALASSGETARFIDVSIPSSAFTAGSWSRVVIDYAKNDTGVTVNGTAVDGATVTYRPALVRSFRSLAEKNGESAGPRYFSVVLEAPMNTVLPSGNFAIDEVCLSDPIASFGSYASGAIAWDRKGPILQLGNTILVSDLSAEGRSELSAVGNPLETESAAGTESGAKGGGKVQATILGAKVSAELGMANSGDTFSWLGAHGIVLPLGPLKIMETFSTDPETETLSHKATIAVSGPVSAEAISALDILPTKITRSWKASMSTSAFERVNASASFLSSYIGPADYSLFRLPYQSAWAESWEQLLPDAGTSERRRDFSADANFAVKGDTIGFTTTAAASSKFNASLDSRVESAELRLGLPFNAAGIDGSFGFVRSYSLTEKASDSAGSMGSASEDAAAFARILSASTPLWVAVPFSTLGDSTIFDSFQNVALSSLASSYSDGIETVLRLPRASGWIAVIQPSALNFTLARAFDRTLDTTVDSIKTSATVQSSAVNVFGAFGSFPIFSFYKSDEFTHALSTTARFPKNEEVDWEIALRQSLSFFGFSDAKLVLSNIVKTGSDGWSDGTALSWTYPQEKSFMKSLYSLALNKATGWKNGPLFAELAVAEVQTENRETVELTISSAVNVAWSLHMKHESIIRATKKLTWITFVTLGASGGRSDGDELGLTIKGSVGLSLSLRF